MHHVVLVVGAAGNLGRRIAAAFLRKPGVTVRLGIRGPTEEGAALAALVAAGGIATRADLDDPASLDAACAGADIVVSTVQGDRAVIVDGQTRLMEAAGRAGAARLIPSDFSFDLFAIGEGENWNSDLRRAFARRLRDSGLGHTVFLNGGFTDIVLSPFMGMVDEAAGTLSFWGDGTMPIDLTTMDDAAAYCAAAALDPDALNRTVEVVGDRITMPELAEAFRPALGRALAPRSLGTLEEGYAELERIKATSADPMAPLPLMYQLPMMSGRARLARVENGRYPTVAPTSVTAFLARRGAPLS